MGYAHIDNLYKNPSLLECYALEKVHGTSAHVAFKGGKLRFFAGGESHERFVALFDEEALTAALAAKFTAADDLTIYGEAFGGKCQGMSETYGKELRFPAFDVQLNEVWLDVAAAAGLAAAPRLGC